MFTNDQVMHMHKLLDAVDRYDLDVDPGFRKASVNTLLETYNGCGPDWLPEDIRELLTRHFEFFEPAFLPHDYDFKFLPKTEEQFHIANWRLYENCMRITHTELSWWRHPIQRLRREEQCWIIYRACEDWGLDGFMEAKA